MTPLDLPGLIVIAMRTLGLDTAGALAELDVPAAEAALAEAAGGAPARHRPGAAATDPPGSGQAPGVTAEATAGAAAALLAALLRHRPLRHGNAPVAVAAVTTYLALGGWQADLEPPGAVREVVAAVEAGRLPAAALAAWLAPRLSPGQLTGSADRAPARRGLAAADDQPRVKEGTMQGWLPGRSRPRRKKGMFRRFSPGARQAVIGSQLEARSLRHGYIGTEHILLGLLHEAQGVAAQALRAAGITEESARQRVVEVIGRGTQEPAGHIPFTGRAKKVLSLALREAADLNHLYIGTGHILLGLLREGDGLACQMLTDLGADSAQIREQVMTLLATPAAEAGELTAGADPEALGREIGRLREEVRRLQDLLLQHGIDAGEPGQRSA